MSGVYPYCVLGCPSRPPGSLVGLAERPVSGREIGPFTVWLSPLSAPPPLDIGSISTHHEVVSTAALASSAVPVRYGGWVPSFQKLSDRILDRRAELEAALATVDGKVEYGVRVSASEDRGDGYRDEPVVDGRSYLRALSREHEERRRRRATQTEIVESLRSCVAEFSCGERVHFLDAPELVTVAHLVDRRLEEEYRRRVGTFLQELQGGQQARMTGPWPPYSFGWS